MATHNSLSRKEIAYGLLLIVIGVLYFSLFYNRAFYPPDEGSIVYQFERCLKGDIPHRDFYSVYGVGFYLLGENLFRFFGASLLVGRIFMVLLKLAMAVLIYFLARRLVRPAFSFLCVLIFIVWWGDPFLTTATFLYPSHISQFLGLLSLWLILIYLKNQRERYVFLAGLAVGLSSLFKPTAAAFNLLALLLFFYCRDMVLDLMRYQSGPSPAGKRFPLGKFGVVLEMMGAGVASYLVAAMFGKFGFDTAMLVFFLAPYFLLVAHIFGLTFRVLRLPVKDGFLWDNFKTSLRLCLLCAAGCALWQMLQVLYFALHGSAKDFFQTYLTATAYYQHYSLALLGGANVMLYSAIGAGVIAGLYIAMRFTAESGRRFTLPVKIVSFGLVAALPVSVYFEKGSFMLSFLGILGAAVFISLLMSLFLLFRDSAGSIRENDSSLLGLQLIVVYSTVILLDGYPRADPGHISAVLPSFFILFGYLLQKFYDSWKNYFDSSSKTGAIAGATLTTFLVLGLLLPNFFMMTRFYFLIALIPGKGLYFLQGRLAPAPRVPIEFERARGITLHMLDGVIMTPLQDPTTRPFLEVAGRVADITQPGDRVFSTDTWGRMLYFLAERDGLSGKANDYVWQSVSGVTTSDAFPDFSDLDLTRQIQAERPAAIVVRSDYRETRLFKRNWPTAWGFIQSNYRLSERVGPFEIYVPSRREQ